MTYQVETRRPEKCTIVYKIKFCVNDERVLFVCYNTSGWKSTNLVFLALSYWVRHSTFA